MLGKPINTVGNAPFIGQTLDGLSAENVVDFVRFGNKLPFPTLEELGGAKVIRNRMAY